MLYPHYRLFPKHHLLFVQSHILGDGTPLDPSNLATKVLYFQFLAFLMLIFLVHAGLQAAV